MKTNKLAAGALALALGLGAVTPAFAAESTATDNSGKGEVIVTAEYRDAETKFVEAFQAAKEAEKTLGELKTIRDSKYEVYQKALEAIDDYNEELKKLNDSLASNEREAQIVLQEFEGNGGDASKVYGKKLVDVTKLDLIVVENDETTEEELNNQVNKKDEYLAHVQREREIIAAINELVDGGKTLNDLQNKANKALEEYQQALNEYNKQIAVVDAAKVAYDDAREDFLDAGADRSAIGAAEKYGDVSYVTEDKTDDSEGEDDKASADEVIEEAEAALKNAEITKAAAELLLDKTPETVKSIKDELVELLAEQEEKIEALNKALDAAKGESVALSDILFSTAYAAEGEEGSEESNAIDELKKATEDLNENTNAINELLEENEEANKKANDDADSDTADSDDKNEPADTDDKNEPADTDDKTNADVNKSDENEEEPAEKTETKTEVKTVKKPAKNAKTGVVGVAGVAGVLAAASVAYAASKKNN